MSNESTNLETLVLRCPECDYILTGTPGNRCPGCGWEIDVEALAASGRYPTGGRRVVVVLVCLVIGLVTLLAIGRLLARGRHLTVRDGFATLAVLIAAFGHLGLAVVAALNRSTWPLRRGEMSRALAVAGGLSMFTATLGATAALGYESTPLYNREGFKVNGVFEFAMAASFLSVPAMLLFVMRLLAYRAGVDRAAGSSARGSTTPGRVLGAPFRIDVAQRYTNAQVTQSQSQAARPTTPALERAIAECWDTEIALAGQCGGILFNGTLARLEAFDAQPSSLHLRLGTTCYRDFLGTNLHHAAAALRTGADHLANPLGTSVLLVTSDGFLVLGRRSRRVAFHADGIHPFGGMVELADRGADGNYDLFGAALRELIEETAVRSEEVASLNIIGLVRDGQIHQPELLFEAKTVLTRADIRARFPTAVENGEHSAIEFLFDGPQEASDYLNQTPEVTPVAQAALLLHGWHQWGPSWFEQMFYLRYGESPAENRNRNEPA